MNYETAIIFLADAVAADPFRMDNFRKYGFWAKCVIKASETGRIAMAKKAYAKMFDLEDDLDIFADITGVMPAIYNEARNSLKTAIAA